jgi:Tol biopolymer transport system component
MRQIHLVSRPWCLWIAAALALVSNLPAQEPPPPSASSSVQEELIVDLATAGGPSFVFAISPDLRRTTLLTKRGKQYALFLDGRQLGGVYDEIQWQKFSPDSQHFAFSGRRGRQSILVIDGVEQEPMKYTPALVYSKDGRRIAYLAAAADKYRVILDGNPGPDYEAVGLLEFSPDGRRFAYAALRKGKWVVLLDGQENSKEYDDISLLTFSPDSARLFYAGKYRNRMTGDEWVMVIDGKEDTRYTLIGGLVFSDDGQHHAYAGARDPGMKAIKEEHGQGTIVHDGQPGPVFQGILISSGILTGFFYDYTPTVTFSLSAPGCGVSPPRISPDGKRVAYLAHTEAKGKDFAVVLDGQPGPTYQFFMTHPAFTPDSQHVVYFVKVKDTVVELRDHKVVREIPFKNPIVKSVTFSADSRRMAFLIDTGGAGKAVTFVGADDQQTASLSYIGAVARRRVVVEGDAPQEFEFESISVGAPIFSPNGKYLAVPLVQPRDRKALVAVNGQQEKPYDRIFEDTLKFLSENELLYAAREGQKILRVTQKLP